MVTALDSRGGGAMRSILVLGGLAACWAPTDTSSVSMIGLVLDADGLPVKDLHVHSIEARDLTDEQGRFAVNYKEPDQYVMAQQNGLTLRRAYTPLDDGTVVQLQFPSVGEVPYRCEGVSEPCELDVTWRLGPETTVKAKGRCDEDAGLATASWPEQRPETATCRTNVTATPTVLYPWARRSGGFRFTPEPYDLTIGLAGSPSVKHCASYGDAELLEGSLASGWTSQAWGPIRLTGFCDEIPILPRALYVMEDADVALQWSPQTPWVDLGGRHPKAESLKLFKRTGQIRGWWQELPRGEDGRFRLPPLTPGNYIVGLHAEWDMVFGAKVDESSRTDVLQFVTLPASDAQGEPWVIGALKIETDRTDGRIPVVWQQIE